MKHRIPPATIIAAVALFFSLAGAGMATGQSDCRSMQLIATPTDPANGTAYCNWNVEVHVAVNGHELLIADPTDQGWGGIFYGNGTVVHIRQSHRWIISILGVTVRPRAHIRAWFYRAP